MNVVLLQLIEHQKSDLGIFSYDYVLYKKNDIQKIYIFAGICLQLFLNIGVSKSFGLFFIQFLVAYNTTASLLSVVIATQTAAFSLTCKYIYINVYQSLVI